MNTPIPLGGASGEAAASEREDPQILLAILDAIDSQNAPSQRSIATRVGVALGVANAYVRHCVHKGYVKLSQAPSNRYLYYLTPKGLSEKTRLASSFLQQSLHLFREARSQYATLVGLCERNGWKRLVLAGGGDMAEIALLCTLGRDVLQVVGIWPASSSPALAHLPVLNEQQIAAAADVVLVTSITEPAALAAKLTALMPPGRVLVPTLLLGVRFRSEPPKAEDLA